MAMDLNTLEVVLFSLLVAVSVWIFVKLYKRRTYREPGMRYLEHGHVWHRTDFIKMPTYCNSCEKSCINGRYCACCDIRVCSSDHCLREVMNTQNCKYIPSALTDKKRSSDISKRQSTGGHVADTHHWICGNLQLDSVCMVCHLPCGSEPKLVDRRCAWCFKSVHDCCFDSSNGSVCSLGEFHSLMLPPSSMQLSITGHGRGKRLVVTGMSQPPGVPGWTPLLAMVNPKSGGQDGERVLAQLMRLLNPIQVVNLEETAPEVALQMCGLLPDVNWRVVVCGGDGTVGWVLGALDRAKLPNRPPVGILPLGTGNDLARVLGWGGGYEGEPLSGILSDIEHALVTKLDRWTVAIQGAGHMGIQGSLKTFVMNSYLGVGCDAGVALNFHTQRQSNPGLFISRYFNKAWYLGYGAKDALEQSCKSLESKIEVWLDGKKLELPSLEGVVVLNINSWSAGCRVWTDTADDGLSASSFNDGLLEVVGLYSSVHVGKIQVKLDEAVRLGQAKSVTISLLKTMPVQIDGEPWQQKSSIIRIQHLCKSPMLCNNSEMDVISRTQSSTSSLLNFVLDSVTEQM